MGCKFFQNPAKNVEDYFYQVLVENPIFKDCFDKIVFAIYDNSKEKKTVEAFKDTFK